LSTKLHAQIDHIAHHWNEMVTNTTALTSELEVLSKENEGFVDFYLEAKEIYERVASRFDSISQIHQKLRELAGPLDVPVETPLDEAIPEPVGGTFH
jgi:hypothetical protein